MSARTTFLVGLLAILPHDSLLVAQEITIADRDRFPVETLPAERMALGEPGDYKPCIARLPDGELLLTGLLLREYGRLRAR